MELSLQQRKLLRLLCLNARFSDTELGTATGLSADAVKYQTQKLLEEEKLGTFVVQFNQWMLGYNHYYYLARLKDPTKLPLEKLHALPFVTFIMRCVGRYDVQLFIITRDDLTFERDLQEIQRVLEPNVQEYTTLKLLNEQKWSVLFPELAVPVTIPKNQKSALLALPKEDFGGGTNRTLFPIDDVDKIIIKQLLINPRTSYLDLAKKAGVSHETVRQRMKKYVATEFLMHCGLFPNYRAFGYYTHMLLLRLSRYDAKQFAAFAKSKPYIIYLAQYTGSFTCILYTVNRNPDEFAEQVAEIRAACGDTLLDLELLYWQSEHKNLQFPIEALTSSTHRK